MVPSVLRTEVPAVNGPFLRSDSRPPVAAPILHPVGPKESRAMNAEIPGDLFKELEAVQPAKGAPHQPSVAQKWYDGIIDDILANPGTTVKDTAARLGRSPSTISAICNSDLFKS